MATEEIAAVHTRVFQTKPAPINKPRLVSAVGLTDDDVLRKARREKNGKFARLFDQGDISSYPSHSEADMALVSKIAFYTRDRDQIDRLFRQSALCTEKWNRDDYRNGLIDKVLAGKTDHYHSISELRTAGVFLQRDAEGRSVPHTDLGNGERLVTRHGDNIRWVEEWRSWQVFDGAQWQPNPQALVTLAKETLRGLYVQAASETDDELRRKLAAHARRSEARPRVEAMIALAKPEVSAKPDDFDRDPWLLNVRNGTLDLRTGELGIHDPAAMLTKLADVEYDAKAECPRWEKFLAEVFKQHPDLIPFVQRAVGYSLTGLTREECLFLLAGTGRNGKGTFLKTIQALLGDHAGTADFTTFLERRDRTMRDDVANMRGQRLIVSQEASEGSAFAEGLVKWLTGGDRVRARLLYMNSFEFDPTFKLWLATNHKPNVRPDDAAIWSRIKLVPFDESFDGREDKTLKTTLLAELPGILNWAIKGCLEWQKAGLQFPQSVVVATQEYRDENDQIRRFFEECCVFGPRERVQASAIYSCYKTWTESCGEEALKMTTFCTRLPGYQGIEKKAMKEGKFYIGVGLRG